MKNSKFKQDFYHDVPRKNSACNSNRAPCDRWDTVSPSELTLFRMFGSERAIANVLKTLYKEEEASVEDAQTDDIIERQMKKARYESRDELEKYLAERPVKLSDPNQGLL
ncbi:unnamed protein product [Allacma fusca]|uniref:Uncharacterized protein n=1 Tax=Allacma fusca TaxID=39272 RepID=A0A8J2NXT5_9HEXA|nr:unnamed protein product [Allacma fusca]